jgi:indole-3-glycerol phosphate synthase
MNILEEIADHTRVRISEEKKQIDLPQMRRMAEEAHRAHKKADFAFADALAAEGISFICEIKKASPSKGLIAPDFPYLQLPRNMRPQALPPSPA